MMEQMDLFATLGFEPVNVSKDKKKSTKAITNSEKKEGKETKKNDGVKFPLTVYSGYMEPVVLTAADFSDTKEVELKMVLKLFSERYPSFSSSLHGMDFLGKKKDEAYVYAIGNYASEKVTIKANEKTKFMLGNHEFDLKAIMSNSSCDLPAAEVIELFKKDFPQYGDIKLLYREEDNIVIPYFSSTQLFNPVKFPIRVQFFGNDELIITEEEYNSFCSQDEKTDKNIVDETDVSEDEELEDEELENEEEENDEEVIEGKGEKLHTADTKYLQKLLDTKYPKYKGLMKLLYYKPCNSVIITLKEPNKNFKKKEILYPTNVTVSIYVSTKIVLSPDMFNGKTEIEEKELKHFIEERYPEFSPERTVIEYLKDKGIIIASVKGSTKGADIAPLPLAGTEKEEQEYLSKFGLCNRIYENGDIYRVEKSDISLTRAATSGSGEHNTFEYYLPKIHWSMIKVAKNIFSYIYDTYRTEAMLQLFWNQENKTYFWHMPKQVVYTDSVCCERNSELEHTYYLIADFHSHGKFNAFWSNTDNQDEKGTRIYGVFGNFKDKPVQLLLRAGTGGYFINLQKEMIIGEVTEHEAYVSAATKSLLSDIKERLIYIY